MIWRRGSSFGNLREEVPVHSLSSLISKHNLDSGTKGQRGSCWRTPAVGWREEQEVACFSLS